MPTGDITPWTRPRDLSRKLVPSDTWAQRRLGEGTPGDGLDGGGRPVSPGPAGAGAAAA